MPCVPVMRTGYLPPCVSLQDTLLLRPGIPFVLLLCLCACASSEPVDQAQTASDGAASQSQQPVWRFDFVDDNQDSLGYLLLAFTAEAVDEPTCGKDYRKKMRVVEDRLDFDLGVEAQPAYSINGPWLTIDLTASVCYIDHNLIGDITDDGATGFFTYSHRLGGRSIGSFTAHPVSATSSSEPADFPG